MRAAFHVTYEIVTQESAEHGESADNGFCMPRGWKYSVAAICGEAAGKIKAECALELREALRLVSGCEDSGSWFTECDGREDYKTGDHERRSLHCPDGITAASYGRVARLLGIQKRESGL